MARLHSSHTSPEGKFGFHCTTYNGDLPQDNTWFDSWEVFFDNGLRHVLRVREERAGPNAELDELLPSLFDKVIPRLLRPLESDGRKIEPSLVHGDMWCGNVANVEGPEEGIVFDPSSFWAHNECMFFPSIPSNLGLSPNHTESDELGNWRPDRNRMKAYCGEYLSLIPPAEPNCEFDDRNALYSLYDPQKSQNKLPGAAIVPWESADSVARTGGSICTPPRFSLTKSCTYRCTRANAPRDWL